MYTPHFNSLPDYCAKTGHKTGHLNEILIQRIQQLCCDNGAVQEGNVRRTADKLVQRSSVAFVVVQGYLTRQDSRAG